MAFFSWTAALRRILTADNLRRRGIILVSWCCLCKEDGESVDHLLLHCAFAKELWDMVFAMFGIQCVMPKRVVDLFDCWQGKFGQHRNVSIWRAIPHCLMWCLSRERNARTFEGSEHYMAELKLLFLRTLFDWISTSGQCHFSTLLDFIDSCCFWIVFFCLVYG